MTTASFDSFGRIVRRPRPSIGLERLIDSFSAVADSGETLLGFGNGRSYGDSCHNDGGLLVSMRSARSVIAFDPTTGLLTAEAGVTLEELIAHTAPHGYFLPVTPGTRFVTLGGAIANDVHGKNHHVRGSFGNHVESFELLRSDGVVHPCSEDENPTLFAATIGGMGLTGLILTARIRMMRVGSLSVNETIAPFANLEDYFDQAEAADAANEYAVAWVDQLASGKSATRGILLTGNHAEDGNFETPSRALRLSVPFEMPFSLLNGVTLRAFNTAYFHSKASKRGMHLSSYGSFFYPLDAVGNWNRLYGRKGLFQHQSIIPFDRARAVIPAMLEASRKAGQASFLTVLKRFGSVASPGILSFPRPGYTLTMDFSNRGASTLALLETLDRMTIEAGGRVNPYKDQRMSAGTFAAGYANWRALEEHRDPLFLSNFWRRTALVQNPAIAVAAE